MHIHAEADEYPWISSLVTFCVLYGGGDPSFGSEFVGLVSLATQLA